jgi:hypothetical protein
MLSTIEYELRHADTPPAIKQADRAKSGAHESLHRTRGASLNAARTAPKGHPMSARLQRPNCRSMEPGSRTAPHAARRHLHDDKLICRVGEVVPILGSAIDEFGKWYACLPCHGTGQLGSQLRPTL